MIGMKKHTILHRNHKIGAIGVNRTDGMTCRCGGVVTPYQIESIKWDLVVGKIGCHMFS
jgi:hypothetical protein